MEYCIDCGCKLSVFHMEHLDNICWDCHKIRIDYTNNKFLDRLEEITKNLLNTIEFARKKNEKN